MPSAMPTNVTNANSQPLMSLMPEGQHLRPLLPWEQMEKQLFHMLGCAEWQTSTSAETPRVTPELQ